MTVDKHHGLGVGGGVGGHGTGDGTVGLGPEDCEVWGVPDLSRRTEPPETYYENYRRAIRDNDYGGRVEATWGLIAQGEASIPIFLEMLRAPQPESREDAAGGLQWLGDQPGVVEALCAALPAATTHEDRDSIVCALGGLKNRKAIGALAVLIRDEGTDGDTQWTAVQSLGTIVRRRFDRQPDPRAAALKWLDAHPSDA